VGGEKIKITPDDVK
jgi:ATP-dependent DNA helicase 2 subunit 1